MTTEFISPTLITDNQIIPEDIQNELIYYRDLRRKNAFAIGDIANHLVERSAEQGFPVTDQRVFTAVGHYCDLRPRTIRYYAETAAFFPVRVRDEYDMCPFSHFVFARHMDGKWQDVLEYSALHPGVSVEYLTYVFCGLDDVVNASAQPRDDNGEVVCAESDLTPCAPIQPLVVCADPPEAGTYRFTRLLSSLSDAVSSLERLLSVAGLSDEASSDLTRALASIRKWLPAIARLERKA